MIEKATLWIQIMHNIDMKGNIEVEQGYLSSIFSWDFTSSCFREEVQ